MLVHLPRQVLPNWNPDQVPVDCCWDVKHNVPKSAGVLQTFCGVEGSAHIEVHGARQGTTYPKPIQSLTYRAIYSGGSIPIHVRCVEKPLTQIALSPPSLSLTFALSRFSRRAQAIHKHCPSPIRSPVYPFGMGYDSWPNDTAKSGEIGYTNSLGRSRRYRQATNTCRIHAGAQSRL